ncbi:MAG TPA: hypothetical protein VM509_05915, partial [Planctomycetota bacterium]|nr:hypothetical protein [Planctomycetota bacterium]
MSAEAAVANTGAFAGLWAWLDDRVNPILVKEVRQALRGRYFRNMFWLTVVGATAISLFTILEFGPNFFLERLGVAFFLANYGVMVVAVNAFVPFWAFQSMSGEWEENTYDLLVISNLRPKQLLLGKALAAGVQSLLFFAAFAPYLVSTFLMGGVDLVSILVVLPATLMVSGALSIVALAIASFGRSRLARAILAVCFIGILLGLVGMTITAATVLIRQPEYIRATEFGIVAGVFASMVVLTASLALAVGCARLAHEHENRSTFLRVITAAISVVMLGWAVQLFFGPSPDSDVLWVMPGTTQIIVILPFLF